MAPVIRRVTMFTTKTEADVDYLVEKYEGMKEGCKKNNSSYILSLTAGPTVPDPRSKGVTFAVIMTFSSLEDMKYYDDEDPTHGALKEGAKGRMAGPPMTVFFEEKIVGGF